MSHGKALIMYAFCAYFCRAQFYLTGFEIKNDRKACLCAERLSVSIPLPMVVTLALPKKLKQSEPSYEDE
mgnify:CR=1 FL=1